MAERQLHAFPCGRMLLYILQLYDQLYRSSRRGKLPAVFPVLLYNGAERWTVPRNIAELIEDVIPGKYIPSFEYYAVIEQTRRMLQKGYPVEEIVEITGLNHEEVEQLKEG